MYKHIHTCNEHIDNNNDKTIFMFNPEVMGGRDERAGG